MGSLYLSKQEHTMHLNRDSLPGIADSKDTLGKLRVVEDTKLTF